MRFRLFVNFQKFDFIGFFLTIRNPGVSPQQAILLRSSDVASHVNTTEKMYECFIT